MKSSNKWVNNYSIFWKWLAFLFDHGSKNAIEQICPYQMRRVLLVLEVQRLYFYP